MEDLLKAFSPAKFSYSVGDRVRGKILRIEPNRVLVDIGGKSEGMVAEKAFQEAESYIKTLKPGDEVDATVLIQENNEGYAILSFRRAKENSLWKILIESKEKEEPISVEGKGVSSAGMTVNVNGLTGFIPMSQLGKKVLENPQRLIGQKFDAVVIDYDRNVRKIILSEKEVSEKEELAIAKKEIEKIREGDTFEAEVTTIFDFGVFVKIESGKKGAEVPLEGLVHISELSWEKVNNPASEFSEGQKVRVKVIGNKNGKLAFSIKQAMEDPWNTVEKKYPKEKKVKGKVIRLADFGCFVQLEPGIEGLIHITKIPPDKKLKRGDEVNVYVEEVDRDKKKISLGLMLTEKPIGYK